MYAITIAIIASVQCSYAGPRSPQIDRMQGSVDAMFAATTVAGSPGRQSTAAMKHRQPTPSSIAAAEARMEEGERTKRAAAALAQAREADRAGDSGACERALANVRREIGQVAGHKQMADRRVMGLHPRLRRDQEKFRWRAALPWWQSQRRGGAWHPLFDVASIALKNSVEQLKGFLLTDVKAGLQRKHRQVCGTAPNEEAGDGTNEGVGWLRCLTFAESFAGRESITPGIRSPHLGGIDPLAAGSTEPRDQLNTVHAEIGRLVANTFGT